jgi:hypothetical protein
MAVEACLRKPNARVRFACNTQASLKKILKDSFGNLFVDVPDNIKPIFKESEKVYIFHNGSEIHLSGCNNQHYEKLRGVSADVFILDEAGTVDELEYVVEDIAIPQLLSTEGKLIMASTPPRSPAHPFKGYCLQAELQRAYSKFTIYDSHYPKKTIERFKKEAGGADSTTWLREYMAEFVVDSETAIVPEWKDDFVVDSLPKPKYYGLLHKYVGLDIGVSDKTVAIFGYYDFPTAKIVIEDEWALEGAMVVTDTIAKLTRDCEANLWGEQKPYRRIADNNNLVLINDLSILHDINFIATDKEALEAMVNQVRLWVKQGRILVHKNCEQLIGCLKYGIWDNQRKKFDRAQGYGHFDALAALIYLVRNIDTATNPIPYDFGYDRKEVFSIERPRLSNNAKTLDQAFSAHQTIFRRK